MLTQLDVLSVFTVSNSSTTRTVRLRWLTGHDCPTLTIKCDNLKLFSSVHTVHLDNY